VLGRRSSRSDPYLRDPQPRPPQHSDRQRKPVDLMKYWWFAPKKLRHSKEYEVMTWDGQLLIAHYAQDQVAIMMTEDEYEKAGIIASLSHIRSILSETLRRSLNPKERSQLQRAYQLSERVQTSVRNRTPLEEDDREED
jgi:hypothetical protein